MRLSLKGSEVSGSVWSTLRSTAPGLEPAVGSAACKVKMLEESLLSGGGQLRAGRVAGMFSAGALWVLFMLEAAVILRVNQVWDSLVPGAEMLCQGPPFLRVQIHLHHFWVRRERTHRAVSAMTSRGQHKLKNGF